MKSPILILEKMILLPYWEGRFPALAKWARKGIRFGITTLCALLLHLIINGGGVELLHISSKITYPISLAVITLASFLLFRFFVYEGGTEKKVALQGGQFILATIVFRLLEWGFFTILNSCIGVWYAYAIIIVQITGTLSKFVFYNFFIFGKIQRKAKSQDQGEVK